MYLLSRRYKSRATIVADILTAAMQRATASQILSYGSLNSHRTRKYLRELQDAGLIEAIIEEKRTKYQRIKYQTTEKGKDFVKLYKIINQIFPI